MNCEVPNDDGGLAFVHTARGPPVAPMSLASGEKALQGRSALPFEKEGAFLIGVALRSDRGLA